MNAMKNIYTFIIVKLYVVGTKVIGNILKHWYALIKSVGAR